MTQAPTRTRRVPTKPATRTATPQAAADLRVRLEAAMKAGRLPVDKLEPDTFDSWEDAEDLMQHYATAPVEPLGYRDISGERRRAKARTNSVASTTGAKTAALARARTKPPAPAANQVLPTRPDGTPIRTAPTMAQRVQPGVSLGPPRRFIGLRFITPDIDVSEAQFRRQKYGIGKCTGSNLTAVRQAYAAAYVMLESAKHEVRAIKRSGTEIRVLWHASMESERAALSYWFGENYSHDETLKFLHRIDDMLTEWSMAFCGGFRDILPVFIRCKTKNGVGGGPARHVVKNTIELFPRYFDLSREKQAITMLHEMGHRCKSLLKPRDERNDLCSGGWNRKKNMCYRDTSEVNTWNQMFRGGNPRILAEAATEGSSSAKKTLLNNIDNYICYMWNRYADHDEKTMYLLSEGGKPAGLVRTGRGKPLG